MSHADPTTWTLVAMHDESKRRGVWYRVEYEPLTVDRYRALPRSVELCAGREGDDGYVRLAVGDVLTERQLYLLYDVLSTASWMTDCYVPDVHAPREKTRAMFDQENERKREDDQRSPKSSR
jgi:hypothetical protein